MAAHGVPATPEGLFPRRLRHLAPEVEINGSSTSEKTRCDVIDRLLAAVIVKDIDAMAELYSADAVLENPFRPGWPAVRGRDAIRAHFALGFGRAPVRFDAVRSLTVHEAADPEVVIAEYTLEGMVLPTGEAFLPSFVTVVRLRDGLIVHMRDYEDLAGRARALASGTGRPTEG